MRVGAHTHQYLVSQAKVAERNGVRERVAVGVQAGQYDPAGFAVQKFVGFLGGQRAGHDAVPFRHSWRGRCATARSLVAWACGVSNAPILASQAWLRNFVPAAVSPVGNALTPARRSSASGIFVLTEDPTERFPAQGGLTWPEPRESTWECTTEYVPSSATTVARPGNRGRLRNWPMRRRASAPARWRRRGRTWPPTRRGCTGRTTAAMTWEHLGCVPDRLRAQRAGPSR